MEDLKNVSHDVNISGVRIYYANYKKAVTLVKESLYLIFSSLNNDNIVS